MGTREAPTRAEGLTAYVLSALTTLLWVGCVLPAGAVARAAGPDAATPVHREALLLVPALLLLVIVPVGCTLALRASGMRAILAAMDGFVVLYVALAMVAAHLVRDGTTVAALALLLLLAALSGADAVRQVRPLRGRRPGLSGARLAIALLVLLLPLHVLLRADVERASLLAPFLFVAVSAGGSRLARSMRGLRRTAAVLQVLLGAHLLVTLRYTMFRRAPVLGSVNVAGKTTLALAAAVIAAALLQLVLFARPLPSAAIDEDPAAVPAA
jgi:hypothetical protein